jgi:hypothetical protein
MRDGQQVSSDAIRFNPSDLSMELILRSVIALHRASSLALISEANTEQQVFDVIARYATHLPRGPELMSASDGCVTASRSAAMPSGSTQVIYLWSLFCEVARQAGNLQVLSVIVEPVVIACDSRKEYAF